LNDYKTIRKMGRTSYLSSKVQTEYDCAKERIRRLASTFFSGNMGSGGVVYSISKKGKWQRLNQVMHSSMADAKPFARQKHDVEDTSLTTASPRE
jgi:hypothetical protein